MLALGRQRQWITEFDETTLCQETTHPICVHRTGLEQQVLISLQRPAH